MYWFTSLSVSYRLLGGVIAGFFETLLNFCLRNFKIKYPNPKLANPKMLAKPILLQSKLGIAIAMTLTFGDSNFLVTLNLIFKARETWLSTNVARARAGGMTFSTYAQMRLKASEQKPYSLINLGNKTGIATRDRCEKQCIIIYSIYSVPGV